MAETRWTLMDLDHQVYTKSLQLGRRELGTAARDCSVKKSRLQGGLQDGVDFIEIDNGACWFSLLPTRGMGIWKARLGGLEFGWNSPIKGPVHPNFVPLYEEGGLGWLDGFDELLVRCGLASNGAPDFDSEGRLTYPVHGKIANLPAHFLEVSVERGTGEISVTGIVDETRFHFSKLRLISSLKTSPGERGFRIIDRVENLSENAAEAQLLYHFNFGPPLLDAGAKIVTPLQTLVPRDARAAEGIQTWESYDAAVPGFAEQVYFCELLADQQSNTQVLLKNAHGMLGASLLFNKKQLPYFAVWKNTTGLSDGYVTGIEPATNFPNPRGFEGDHNRVVKLPPLGSATFEVEVRFHDHPTLVEQAEQEIMQIRGGREPKIYPRPISSWCGRPTL